MVRGARKKFYLADPSLSVKRDATLYGDLSHFVAEYLSVSAVNIPSSRYRGNRPHHR